MTRAMATKFSVIVYGALGHVFSPLVFENSKTFKISSNVYKSLQRLQSLQ